MAKCTAPLMSFSASGTIAKGLTFSLRPSGQQVRWQRKQKDRITAARREQRDKFLEAVEAWGSFDFGVQEYGFQLCGGKEASASGLPLARRAPNFALYVRDWLGS